MAEATQENEDDNVDKKSHSKIKQEGSSSQTLQELSDNSSKTVTSKIRSSQLISKFAEKFQRSSSSLTENISNSENAQKTPTGIELLQVKRHSSKVQFVQPLEVKPSDLNEKHQSDIFRRTISRQSFSFPTFPIIENVERSESLKPYNPFGSFTRGVSISEPKSSENIENYFEGTDDWEFSRRKSITAEELAKKNIAICFFPENPDKEDGFIQEHRFSPTDYQFVPKYDENKYKRDRWYSRLIYLIAVISYSISFSNIYHFPALVYQCGGVFLIPYTIFTVILAYPLHFLESSLGQYSQSGPVKVWDCVPIARGIGLSMFFLCLFVAYYYNMYGAYSVVYFARCFKQILPWSDCDQFSLLSHNCVPRMCARNRKNEFTPAQHYFFNHVLQLTYAGKILSQGLGRIIWPLVLGFFLAWVVVYAVTIQSVKSIGKIASTLVILPYFVLLMFLTAGYMLEGSSQGRDFLLRFNFSELLNIHVWRLAAEQVFLELGLCQGTPLAYSSYCRHRNPTHIDSAIICLFNYLTSMLSALCVFNMLGVLSWEMGTTISNIFFESSGLIFVIYPDVLCRIPGSNFWCIAFFLMLFSVVIGTQVAVVETLFTVFYDEFPSARPYRWLINLTICVSLFLIGLVLCTSNGYFIVHLIDKMTAVMPRLPIGVCLYVAIVFIYGIEKYCEDMHFMINFYPNMFFKICFYISPILLLVITVPSWILKEKLTLFHKDYFIDALVVGWFTVWFILIWILLGSIYWYMYCFSIGKPAYIFRSLNSWGPRDLRARIARTEFSSVEDTDFTTPWNQ